MDLMTKTKFDQIIERLDRQNILIEKIWKKLNENAETSKQEEIDNETRKKYVELISESGMSAAEALTALNAWINCHGYHDQRKAGYIAAIEPRSRRRI